MFRRVFVVLRAFAYVAVHLVVQSYVLSEPEVEWRYQQSFATMLVGKIEAPMHVPPLWFAMEKIFI